jgi:hypothetical protein
MVDKKIKKSKTQSWGCPSQCMEGLTQIDKAGVLIPVEFQNRSSRCRCYSNRNSNNRSSWSYASGMTASNEGLGHNKRWQGWVKRFLRRKKLQGGSSSSTAVPSDMSLKVLKRGWLARLKAREIPRPISFCRGSRRR